MNKMKKFITIILLSFFLYDSVSWNYIITIDVNWWSKLATTENKQNTMNKIKEETLKIIPDCKEVLIEFQDNKIENELDVYTICIKWEI